MWRAWCAAVVAVCSVLGAGPAVGSVPGVGRGAGAVAGPVAVLCRCCASVLVLVLVRVVDCGRLGLALNKLRCGVSIGGFKGDDNVFLRIVSSVFFRGQYSCGRREWWCYDSICS